MMISCLKWRISVNLRHGVEIMIGVLVFPDFQLQDAAGPISVYEVAARYAGVSPAIRILAATPGGVRSSSGVEVFANGFGSSRAITTLIVVGGEKVPVATTCNRTLSFVRTMARRGV